MAGKKSPRFEPHRDGDVVLRDGSTVRIRLMRPSDEAGLCELLTSLSEESRWLRFYCNQNRAAIAAEAHREANLDHAFGLIACSGKEERVVGHAFYVAVAGRTRPSSIRKRDRHL